MKKLLTTILAGAMLAGCGGSGTSPSSPSFTALGHNSAGSYGLWASASGNGLCIEQRCFGYDRTALSAERPDFSEHPTLQYQGKYDAAIGVLRTDSSCCDDVETRSGEAQISVTSDTVNFTARGLLEGGEPDLSWEAPLDKDGNFVRAEYDNAGIIRGSDDKPIAYGLAGTFANDAVLGNFGRRINGQGIVGSFGATRQP